MTAPLMMAFWLCTPAEKSKIQGDEEQDRAQDQIEHVAGTLVFPFHGDLHQPGRWLPHSSGGFEAPVSLAATALWQLPIQTALNS
jgi:hypothetical protein